MKNLEKKSKMRQLLRFRKFRTRSPKRRRPKKIPIMITTGRWKTKGTLKKM